MNELCDGSCTYPFCREHEPECPKCTMPIDGKIKKITVHEYLMSGYLREAPIPVVWFEDAVLELPRDPDLLNEEAAKYREQLRAKK